MPYLINMTKQFANVEQHEATNHSQDNYLTLAMAHLPGPINRVLRVSNIVSYYLYPK